MKLNKEIRVELNSRIFTAMFKLSGVKATKATKSVNFFIGDFHLETNFITGEVIWVHGDTEIYILPYLISDNISIAIYKADQLVVSEIINVNIQTKKIISGEWTTHDYINFLIDVSMKKILEFKNLSNKKN